MGCGDGFSPRSRGRHRTRSICDLLMNDRPWIEEAEGRGDLRDIIVRSGRPLKAVGRPGDRITIARSDEPRPSLCSGHDVVRPDHGRPD